MMGDFCHGCLRPLPPGQHCDCPAVRAAWPAALAHFWSEVADGRSVAISVVSDLPPGSEFTLATQKPSPLSARKPHRLTLRISGGGRCMRRLGDSARETVIIVWLLPHYGTSGEEERDQNHKARRDPGDTNQREQHRWPFAG